MGRNYDVIIFQRTFILRTPKLASFANIIKIATMFNKTTFKDTKNYRRVVGRIQKVFHVVYRFFGSSLDKYNYSKFHHYRVCLRDFREGGPIPSVSRTEK